MEFDSIVKNIHIAMFKIVAVLNQIFKEHDKIIAKWHKDINEMRENTKDNFQEFKFLITKIFDKIRSILD
jgi:hypothetical protein